MNSEERSAFIVARSAMLNAQVALMQASNRERELLGLSFAYGESAFESLLAEYQDLGYNDCAIFLRGDNKHEY